MPKAVEATFCSKTGPIFSCGSNKLCPNPIRSKVEATSCKTEMHGNERRSRPKSGSIS